MNTFLKRVLALTLTVLMLGCSAVYAEETVNYVNSDELLEIGTKTYSANTDYEYNVYELAPEEIGEYTVSAENGALGIVSYNGMWVSIDPNEETVSQTSVVWECTAVGQVIWVAVKTNGATASLTVSREEIVIVTIPRTPYENRVTPSSFTFEGNADDLLYVDTFDNVEDKAVFGEDGFYHLNSADGPVLYAKLNDPLMSLVDANSYGQLLSVVYDNNGDVVEKIDYYNAFEAYYACADETNCIYPLTDDLIAIFANVGETNNWYGADESAWVGGELDDAWMYACYYLPSTSTLSTFGDVDANGTLDTYDLLMVKRAFFNTMTLTEEQIAAADVIEDGVIDSYDYMLIKRAYYGTYTPE